VPPIVKTIIAAAQVLVPAVEKVLGIAGVARAERDLDDARPGAHDPARVWVAHS
jgi:hypothetical protein